MKLFATIGSYFLLSLPFAANAYERAEEILWACNGDTANGLQTTLEKSHCIGYVSGILDGAQLVFAARPESRFFCPPETGISADQQLRIVTKFLEDNPSELHESARMAVLIAYGTAFPCK